MDYKDAVELQKYRTCGAVDDVIRDQRTLSAYTQLGTIDEFRAFIREKRVSPRKEALLVSRVDEILQSCVESIRSVIVDPDNKSAEVANLMRAGISERKAHESFLRQSLAEREVNKG